ncbi:hypothetical protein IU437_25685 [Nocardia farcinica]|nr:hypothetical protein [Nocardia farcinica]
MASSTVPNPPRMAPIAAAMIAKIPPSICPHLPSPTVLLSWVSTLA